MKQEGPRGYTANKVAEKAGVNISSFYQYYPNKEVLLFHIIRINWEKQLANLTPILTRGGHDHARKLRDFIREFLMIEAAEANLRRAIKIASIDLKDSQEFQALMAQGFTLLKELIEGAVDGRALDDLDFEVNFIVLLVTSFAERTTDEGTSGASLIRQADLLSDILIAHFRIH